MSKVKRQRVYIDLDVADALGVRAKSLGVDLFVLLDRVLRDNLTVELKELIVGNDNGSRIK